MESIKEVILVSVFFILFLILIAMMNMNDGYHYECVDYFGNTVYCESIDNQRGNIYGWQEDGTKIKITSYKMVKD